MLAEMLTTALGDSLGPTDTGWARQTMAREKKRKSKYVPETVEAACMCMYTQMLLGMRREWSGVGVGVGVAPAASGRCWVLGGCAKMLGVGWVCEDVWCSVGVRRCWV